MTSNIVTMDRENNDDVFIKMCNSPKQQERRKAKRKKARSSLFLRVTCMNFGLFVAGVMLGLLLGAVLM